MEFFNYVFVLLITTLITDALPTDDSSRGTGRSALSFGHMIKSVTGRNPLDYNGYGCWCGDGGRGNVLDEVDQCCNDHDLCYARYGQLAEFFYLKPYLYSIIGQTITCLDLPGVIGKDVCECDKIAAECMASRTFDTAFQNYDKSSC